jgi:hypothetical protein
MDIQIRAVETIPAIGTDHFAILFVHFMAAAVAEVTSLFGGLSAYVFGCWR